MVKYVGEAEFDYHSLNYGGDAHMRRARKVAIYRFPLLLLLLLQLLLMLEELALSLNELISS